MVGRYVLGALAVAMMGLGAVLVVRTGTVWEVVLWLVGAIVLHDGLIAPLVLGLGLLLAALPARGTVRAGLIVAGSLTLIALPLMLRPGTAPNPTALPLDYVRNWLVLMGVVALGTGAVLGVRRLAQLRRRS
ncbi:hypothetical protein Q5762_11585 [Streptomyces sp. P9(2023)]|uniref:hypothetical protein n=1 Tax=Streptomyces sp. P9(2023) TaxID=3064394 RepID=UPI0028F431A7|nr:hypothetical protein [Streptomyces sp. P9(2023)]MDT9688970.1 hypothetical protein [Streptomyces sp. P9(2023)]